MKIPPVPQTFMAGIVLLWGITGIVVLDLYALHQGINGTLFYGSIATIAGLICGFCGFTIGKRS